MGGKKGEGEQRTAAVTTERAREGEARRGMWKREAEEENGKLRKMGAERKEGCVVKTVRGQGAERKRKRASGGAAL